MSRPVKVSDEFFAKLQQEAVERGTTLQETLQQHLDAKNRSLHEVEKERAQLRRKVKGLGERIDELTTESSQEKERNEELEEEKAELILDLDEAGSELDELEKVVDQHKREAKDLSAQLDQASAEEEERKRRLNRTVNLLVIGAVVIGLSLLFRRLFPPPQPDGRPEEPTVPTPPLAYPLYR